MAKILRLILLAVFLVACRTVGATEKQGELKEETYSEEAVLAAASEFFGETTKALARVIEKVFKEQGRPNGYIIGTEGSGAIGVGLRYGEGVLHTKSGEEKKVYWQGPSVGLDFGGNFSKVFTLVYHLKDMDALFQRIPGVDGSLYFIGGVSVNYQQTDDLILAPIRTGVGWRAGVSVGYVDYTHKKSWIPF
ncbi:DUF1134 domain-containing protein [Nitrosococcus oceani]|uniref:DUF1134 domain-containing protein n=1 Tax=Nitrosococcus oceani TaxID=1229 RepID=UPI0004E9687B|nr:DUF1134 domain-containing protein [Nitrosococcus oceani]KFI22657.1 hypothetical protein HW44_08150 [Nitrosococcus oceani]